jgi:hypothetical protein
VIRIATGGPSYRLLRSEHSVRSLIELACLCQHSTEYHYDGHSAFHTSNLWTGRASWLRAMIGDASIDVAIACDTDTSFQADRLLPELRRVVGSVHVAIGICPVRIGGTEECNLNIGGKRIRAAGLIELLKSQRRDIESGGFGVAVFNLAWYRANWPLPAPERVEIGLGEDTEHCEAVRSRGGKVIALSVPTSHGAFGENETR